jgi:hypothetical protein
MTDFKKLNNIVGWIVFLIATTVYLLTIEPTSSFWDCGEFIAASYKLEVGHPPGAPLFLLIARFFSLFAGSNTSKVALMINSVSALASSFTILFLFWTITHLATKILIKENEYTTGKIFAIIGSGFIGSLAYTFTDTFWFSAVEGEVYATSSLFTAVVFWAILKWENVAEEKYANRWLILIAYLMGLSIGVHLLNLLAIPAIVFVYYFKKYEPSRRGIFLSSITAVVLLGIIIYVIIPFVVRLAAWFELFFVNGTGLPYNSGIIFYAITVFGFLTWGLRYTLRKGKVLGNTVLLCLTVILIGYSSYSIIIIRSVANPPMDQNNPDNLFTLFSYLNREQYGDRPLIFGQYYSAPLIDIKPGKRTYTKQDGKYIVTNRNLEYKYHPQFTTLFPRMYSREAEHIEDYRNWANIKGRKVSIGSGQDGTRYLNRPTFGENLKFFFKYQLGHMYFRYFMWNFAGRQNDIQGHGNVLHGNWISGIPFIDKARLGDQENLPEHLKNNRARNRYYLLPLLLGIIGLIYQYRKDQNSFWVILLLFFFTGVAVVLYLNQTPHQPRERDYAYAGSFYAFSVWIGLGLLAVYELFSKKLNRVISAVAAFVVCVVFVPVLMAKENWDDHNRSGRFTTRDFAGNYLNSCASNAILFTNGDNDTFPLWYAQEVEGIRTDVRVVNLSYLGADWYINQMRNKAYESDPVPFSLSREKYIQGTRDIVLFDERIEDYYDLKELINFVANDDPRTKKASPYGLNELVDYFPARKFSLEVDSARVMETGTVPLWSADKIISHLQWEYKEEVVYKNDLLVLDLLVANNWERPVYIAVTVPSSSYLGLQEYFQTEGLAYRIVPIKNEPSRFSVGRIDSKIMYDNMMNKFKWGDLTSPNVYLDENNKRMISNFRYSFSQLALALIEEGKPDSAREVLDYCMEIIPHQRVPFDYWAVFLAEAYYKIKETDTASKIVEKLAARYIEELNYYFMLKKEFSATLDTEKQMALHIMQELVRLTRNYDQTEINKFLEEEFKNFVTLYTSSS